MIKLTRFAEFVAYAFHVSQVSLDKLRAAVRAFVPSDMRVSNRDLITAGLSKVVYQCEMPLQSARSGVAGTIVSAFKSLGSRIFGSDQSKADDDVNQIVGMVCGMWHGIGIQGKNYTGNCIISCYVANPAKSLETPITDQSVAEIVIGVRRLIDRVDAGYFGSFMDTVAALKLHFMQFIAYTVTHSMVYLSDHTRFGMYGADFGSGAPEWATIIPSCGNNTAVIFDSSPRQPAGISVFISAHSQVMGNLLANEHWSSISRLLY
ncbi:hypothetical protein GGI12_002082 [Dipsacomyces acuminosporus]|nr:hypothetical protein GGI12_002082 [Dipsacomyces acuminosporus]